MKNPIKLLRPKPAENKQEQQNKINDILKDAGFAYERNGDYFYSLHSCWQRECGYCRLYDEGCPLFNMIIDSEPIEFTYDGKRWLIEFWKGQYGITTGCEIGIYYTKKPDVKSARFTGTFYDVVPDDEMMQMSFALKKDGRTILSRSDRHFWLTGFIPGEFNQPRSLTMDIEIVFPSADMAEAFTQALVEIGYTEQEYARAGATVSISYRHPHAEQNILEQTIDRSVQLINYGNCKIYRAVTESYPDTLDALEHLHDNLPHVFDFMLNSLYAHIFFDAFKWLWKLVKPERPNSDELEPQAPEPPVFTSEPIDHTPEPLHSQEPPIYHADPHDPSERPPLILPMPVLVPKNKYQLRPAAPTPRPTEPSCLSELEPPRSEARSSSSAPRRRGQSMPYSGRPNRGRR